LDGQRRIELRGALVIVASALVGLASACGGGSSSESSDTLPALQAVPVPAAAAVAEIKATLGDKPGAIAVLRALDKGYTAGQIVGAGADKRLAATGEIKTSSGGPESPAGKATGVFTVGRSGAPAARGLAGGYLTVFDPAAVVDKFLETPVRRPKVEPPRPSNAPELPSDKSLTAVATLLTMTGYTAEQILDAMLEGDDFVLTNGGLFLAKKDGRAYCPELAGTCTDELLNRMIGLADEILPAGVLVGPAAPVPAATQASTPASAPTAAASGNRTCTAGGAPAFPAGFQVQTNRFELCFPRGGGASEGSVTVAYSAVDADCTGAFVTSLTLKGTSGMGAVSGDYTGTTTVTLTGACVAERVIFDRPVQNLAGSWQGTFDGAMSKITVFMDPEDEDDTLLFEGNVR
jgi:hypothetical protein